MQILLGGLGRLVLEVCPNALAERIEADTSSQAIVWRPNMLTPEHAYMKKTRVM
jgi:hypothetical protein